MLSLSPCCSSRWPPAEGNLWIGRSGPAVTISLGVAACLPSEGLPMGSLVSDADTALYPAKREGRNRVA